MQFQFENDVKMYGTQTLLLSNNNPLLFENDVKMYGTQTLLDDWDETRMFENDVKMYGTQTTSPLDAALNSALREAIMSSGPSSLPSIRCFCPIRRRKVFIARSKALSSIVPAW